MDGNLNVFYDLQERHLRCALKKNIFNVQFVQHNCTPLRLKIEPLHAFVLKFWTLYMSDDGLADRPKL